MYRKPQRTFGKMWLEYMYIVACRDVSRQRLSKHVPAARDTHARIEVLLEMVFCTRRTKGLFGREPPFREHKNKTVTFTQ
jgi:hypothetical protein